MKEEHTKEIRSRERDAGRNKKTKIRRDGQVKKWFFGRGNS